MNDIATSTLELAFYGELAEGAELQETKVKVAGLFKTSAEQVEKMFCGKRVVIKNKLDMRTAEKYVSALLKNGAVCHIEKMGAPGIAIQSQANTNTELPTRAPVASQSPTTEEPLNPSTAEESDSESEPGIKLAGSRVEEILQNSQLSLDPVGVRLSTEKETAPPHPMPNMSDIEVMPAGSALQDEYAD